MQLIIKLVSHARQEGVSMVYVGVPWVGKEEICERLALLNDQLHCFILHHHNNDHTDRQTDTLTDRHTDR